MGEFLCNVYVIMCYNITATHHVWFDYSVKYNCYTALTYLLLHITLAILHLPCVVREFSAPLLLLYKAHIHTGQALFEHFLWVCTCSELHHSSVSHWVDLIGPKPHGLTEGMANLDESHVSGGGSDDIIVCSRRSDE